MKLIDFKTAPQLTFGGVECRKKGTYQLNSREGRIETDAGGGFRFLSIPEQGEENGVFGFTVADRSAERTFRDYLERSYYALAHVSGSKESCGSFFLHVVFFYRASRETKLDIVLSASVREKLVQHKQLWADNGEEQTERRLQNNFYLRTGTGGETCFAYTAGSEDFFRDMKEEPEAEAEPRTDRPQEQGKVMLLYGQEYTLMLRLREGKLWAEKVFFGTGGREPQSMRLMIGQLGFRDQKSVRSEELLRELSGISGYLKLWNEYSRQEGEFLLKRARSIGVHKLTPENIQQESGGIRVTLPDLSKVQLGRLSENDCLTLTPEIPDYILDPALDWTRLHELWVAASGPGSPKEVQNYRILRKAEQQDLILDRDGGDELQPGYLSLSLWGDMKQIERKEEARTRIDECRAANPALGLLIEGKLPQVRAEHGGRKKIPALTGFVREKVFRQEPTDNQKKAIEIALNTPDIAIIQGPPGTGKTTVICGIVERLNQLMDQKKDNRGQILITSFQHDAVQNVIERMRVNSLPTIKFGHRQEEKKAGQSLSDTTRQWCQERAEALREKNPVLHRSDGIKALESCFRAYGHDPCRDNARALLDCAEGLVYRAETIELIHEIRESLEEEDSRENRRGNRQLLALIRRLRTTEAGFSDDGADNAWDLLSELEALKMEDRTLLAPLEEAAEVTGAPAPDLLHRLEEVKEELLNRCIPMPSYHRETIRTDVVELYRAAAEELERHIANGPDEVLFHLLHELEHNQDAVEEALVSYNLPFAATTQQSEGVEIRRAKGIRWDDHPDYDTVIVDEAARVNPADLMIPMSQARRRIILVGDHRQLPHIYDEEVLESITEGSSDLDKQVIKTSMFEYLFRKAQELQEQDGVQRTITLDAQFRMHPMLGEFVNENFYAPYGENFRSPRPAEDFRQSISPLPVRWIDLGPEKGGEEKRGTSRVRRCEAERIADEVEAIKVRYGDGKLPSLGVITFYSAQVLAIREALKQRGLEQLVHVGSVDAFQGMEYDVVFLSVVRTREGGPKLSGKALSGEELSRLTEDAEFRELVGRRFYGFLTAENRLCVALSRQSRLLTVVGDSHIFGEGKWAAVAAACVPAMGNLYRLCREKGGMLNGEA